MHIPAVFVHHGAQHLVRDIPRYRFLRILGTRCESERPPVDLTHFRPPKGWDSALDLYRDRAGDTLPQRLSGHYHSGAYYCTQQTIFGMAARASRIACSVFISWSSGVSATYIEILREVSTCYHRHSVFPIGGHAMVPMTIMLPRRRRGVFSVVVVVILANLVPDHRTTRPAHKRA